jgi:putative SOS response-associated peptidase YedK
MQSFAIVTCPANDLVAEIHDRMPVILPAEAYDHWLAGLDRDPRGLLVPYLSAPMIMWPITTRVNKPANDDAEILRAIPLEDGEPCLL